MRLRLVTTAVVLLCLLVNVTAGQTRPIPVRIGVLAPRGDDVALRNWGPTAEYLSQQIPNDSFTIVPMTYKSISGAVAQGQVEFVITNPSSYVELEWSAGATRILTMESVRNGVPCHVFGGLIFTRADRAEINTLADLRGKRVIAVEEKSFGGWLTARRELEEQGVFSSTFASLEFAGGVNDNVVYAVCDGKADVGCVRTDQLETMAAEGLIKLADFKTLNPQPQTPECPFLRSTQLYPEWALASLRNTPPGLARRVVIALLTLTPESPVAQAAQSTIWTSPQDYTSVHECLRELHLPPYELEEHPLTARMAASRLRYWLLAAGIITVLIVALLMYLARLSLRLGVRTLEVRDATASVPRIVRAMRRFARVAAVFLVAMPLFVLVGWALRVPAMVSIIPGLVAMNPIVAVCFAVCGVALWWRVWDSPWSRPVADLIGIAVALLAAVKLTGFLIGHDTLVDQLLFFDRLDLVPGLPPNRMAPNTAFSLLLLGSAVATMNYVTRKGRCPSQVLALLASLIAVLALVGYLYKVTSLYHVTTFIPMALHTAAAVVTLSLGVLFARADRGMMAIVSSDTVGGVTARRLLPATILVPVALGWLRVLGQRLGLSDVDFGVSLVILVDIAFFALLVWTTAGLLRRSDLERKKTDVALSRERNLLRGLIDNLPDHIFIKDAQGHYIADNISHAQFVGLSSPEQVEGKTVADFFPPQLAAKFAADDQAVIESGKPLLGREEPIIEKDGTRKWVSTTKVPLRDDKGHSTGLVCISRDITEQVLAAEQLRASETRGRRIVETANDAFVAMDSQGTILEWNPQAETTFGWKRDEALDRPVAETVMPERFRAAHTQGLARFLETGQGPVLGHRLELVGQHRDGHEFPVEVTISATRLGETYVFFSFVHDITARKQAEEQLHDQNVKLNELAKSEREAHQTLKKAQSRMVQSEKLAGLGQLVAGVAHEINNPLSFVSNNVAVLQRDVAAIRKLLGMYQEADALVQSGNPELMERVKDLCERLDLQYTLTNLDDMMVRSREGLKRIQQIVKDLRDFARLDESDLHDIDINQGVDSTVNIIRGRAKSKQVTIDLQLTPLPPVACFPAKINQVVMNLVANAIDACGDNGKVTIRTSALDNGGGVRIEVADTGCGIDPAIRERIFDPFFTTKKQGEGTGLGLSISYGIIQDHGGTIDVDSTPGQGSRFTVTLPLRPMVPRERPR